MTRLALVMIVKNEERSLARCLESVRKHVDKIIILDTGSTDRTIEIAQSFGAEIHHWEWQDDFAAARNAALAHSDATWNLILDADEWLESGAEALSAKNLPPLRVRVPNFVGCVRLTNARRSEDDPDKRIFLPRVLPRGVRYEGRIHEQPVSGLPRLLLPIVFGHDGYTAEQIERKKGRNEALLRAELEINPEDSYLWYQLGRELYVHGEPQDAADCMVRAYNLCPLDSAVRLAIVVYAILLLRRADRYHEALALVDAEQDNWEEAPDFFFAVAELYLEWSYLNPEIARDQLLPVVEAAWLKCLQIGERPGLNSSIEGSGGYRAAYNLANLYKGLSLHEEAAKFEQMSLDLRQAMKLAA
ncbi:glycosyltransferase family 2 protein [Sphingomonas parva]|uniref:Glycosyltransferase family 2 protein n=1 Tax=Sphingomonas parva TaxID=2555898 RepID=A0A4Y8ZUE4_9SPHN|nr:glycosyltransferase family 2 protein [Sphingomonas parva]TFI59631.1 glycosyltransferase family 2 protein [Sphingomonas parva]